MSQRPFFESYTKLVPEADLAKAMRSQWRITFQNFKTISDDLGPVIHHPYRWTITEVIGHMIDTEIVFAYRLLRFSRKDETALPGFDQDVFIANGIYRERSLSSVVAQFDACRIANVLMVEALPKVTWDYSGTASGLNWTVSDLARAIIGHVRYHTAILETRLGISLLDLAPDHS